jgi:hypothetical protein
MWAKVKAFFAMVGKDLVDTWQRIKIPLLAIGGIIAYLKFNQLKDFLLTYAAKKEMGTAQKTDSKDAAIENADVKQADALVAQADALPAQETKVTDDWNTKK